MSDAQQAQPQATQALQAAVAEQRRTVALNGWLQVGGAVVISLIAGIGATLGTQALRSKKSDSSTTSM